MRRAEVRVEQPQLPLGIEVINLSNLAVGDTCIDINFERVQQQVIVAQSDNSRNGVRVYVHL